VIIKFYGFSSHLKMIRELPNIYIKTT